MAFPRQIQGKIHHNPVLVQTHENTNQASNEEWNPNLKVPDESKQELKRKRKGNENDSINHTPEILEEIGNAGRDGLEVGRTEESNLGDRSQYCEASLHLVDSPQRIPRKIKFDEVGSESDGESEVFDVSEEVMGNEKASATYPKRNWATPEQECNGAEGILVKQLSNTGTDVQSNLHKAWAMLRSLKPNVCCDSFAFDHAPNAKFMSEPKRRRIIGSTESDDSCHDIENDDMMNVENTQAEKAVLTGQQLDALQCLVRSMSNMEQSHLHTHRGNEFAVAVDKTKTVQEDRQLLGVHFDDNESIISIRNANSAANLVPSCDDAGETSTNSNEPDKNLKACVVETDAESPKRSRRSPTTCMSGGFVGSMITVSEDQLLFQDIVSFANSMAPVLTPSYPPRLESCVDFCKKFSFCLNCKPFVDACLVYMCRLNPSCEREHNLEAVLRRIAFLIVDNMSTKQQDAIDTYHQFRYVVLGIFTKVCLCSAAQQLNAIESILQALSTVKIEALSGRIRNCFASRLASSTKKDLCDEHFLRATAQYYVLVTKRRGLAALNADDNEVALNYRIYIRACNNLPILSDILGAFANDHNISSFASPRMSSRRFCSLLVVLDVDIFKCATSPETYFQKSLEELVIDVYTRLDLIRAFLVDILDDNAEYVMSFFNFIPYTSPSGGKKQTVTTASQPKLSAPSSKPIVKYDSTIMLCFCERFIESLKTGPCVSASSALLERLTRSQCTNPKFIWSRWHIALRMKLKLPLMCKIVTDFLISHAILPDGYLPFTHLVMGVDTYVFVNAKTWTDYRYLNINGDQVQAAVSLMAKDEVLRALSNSIKSSAASQLVQAFRTELQNSKEFYCQVAALYGVKWTDDNRNKTLELSQSLIYRLEIVLPALADAHASFILDWGIAHTVAGSTAELGKVLVGLDTIIFNSTVGDKYFKMTELEIWKKSYDVLDGLRNKISPLTSAFDLNSTILATSAKHRPRKLSVLSHVAAESQETSAAGCFVDVTDHHQNSLKMQLSSKADVGFNTSAGRSLIDSDAIVVTTPVAQPVSLTTAFDYHNQFVKSLSVPFHLQASSAYLDSLTRRLCSAPSFDWLNGYVEFRVKMQLPIISDVTAGYCRSRSLVPEGYLEFTHLVMAVDTYIFLNAHSWEEYCNELTSSEHIERALSSIGNNSLLAALSTTIRGSATAKAVAAFKKSLKSFSYFYRIRSYYPPDSDFLESRIRNVLPALAEAYSAYVLDWGIACTVVSPSSLEKALVALDLDISSTRSLVYFQMNSIELCTLVYERLDMIRKRLQTFSATTFNAEILMLATDLSTLTKTRKPDNAHFSIGTAGTPWCEQLLESLDLTSFCKGACKFLEVLTRKFGSVDVHYCQSEENVLHRMKVVIPTIAIHLSFSETHKVEMDNLQINEFEQFRFLVFAVEVHIWKQCWSWKEYASLGEAAIKSNVDSVMAKLSSTEIIATMNIYLAATPLELIRIKRDITSDSAFFNAVCNSYSDRGKLSKTIGKSMRQYRARNILPMLAGILAIYLSDHGITAIANRWYAGFTSLLTALDTDIFNCTALKLGTANTPIDVVALTGEAYNRLDYIFGRVPGTSARTDACVGDLHVDACSSPLPDVFLSQPRFPNDQLYLASTPEYSGIPALAQPLFDSGALHSQPDFICSSLPTVGGSFSQCPADSKYPICESMRPMCGLGPVGDHPSFPQQGSGFVAGYTGGYPPQPFTPYQQHGRPHQQFNEKFQLPVDSSLAPPERTKGVPEVLISSQSTSTIALACYEYCDRFIKSLSFKTYFDATIAYLQTRSRPPAAKFTWTKQQFENRLRIIIPLICKYVSDYIIKNSLVVDSFDQFRYFVLRIDRKLFESASSLEAYENKDTLSNRVEFIVTSALQQTGNIPSTTVQGAVVSQALATETENAPAWRLAAQFKRELTTKAFRDDILNKYVEAIKLRMNVPDAPANSNPPITLQSLSGQRINQRVDQMIPVMADILATYLNDYSIASASSMTTARFGNVLVNLDTYIYSSCSSADSYFSMDTATRSMEMFLKLDESFGRGPQLLQQQQQSTALVPVDALLPPNALSGTGNSTASPLSSQSPK